jgi:hypothetical protein
MTGHPAMNNAEPARKTRSRPPYGRWLPVDTAPKDGAQILCFTKYGDYEITHWHADAQCWVSKRGFFVEATHWCPLPKPPDGP